MASNDVNLAVYREDAAGIKQIEVIQKLDSTDCTNLFDADAIPASKVDLGAAIVPSDLDAGGTAAAGSLAIPYNGFVIVPDGADADIVAFTAPVKSKISRVSGVKTGGAGGAGDEIQIRTAAAGGGSLISSLDVNVADLTVLAGGIDDSVNEIAAGASVYVRRIEGAANGSAEVVVEFTPVD